MNKILKYLLLLSALIPATGLVLMRLPGIVEILNHYNIQEENASISDGRITELITIILGIMGYIGLIKLALNFADKPDKSVLFFLIAGVASFVLLLGPYELYWKRVFTIERPGEWFLLVWPTIVSILFIVRTGWGLTQKNTQTSE
ncbi:hypothetical protein [Xanthocytophaga agilis]|uniref:hypothetical protein n=1 Tax=Xanthocytophaga agilis TaxID=3048010 RepID=UPI0028D78447|nr:hypothetical protein [Xanthocytophaga agilis]